MSTRLILAAATASMMAFSAHAHAGDFEFPYEYSELDTAEGREALLDRVQVAARHYCRDAAPVATLRPRRAACVEDVLQAVADQLGHPQFTALVHEADAA